MDLERAQGEAPTSWSWRTCANKQLPLVSVHVLYPWGVRMCCHGMVYERFSQQRSNVNPDSCPAPLESAVVVLVHHLFASSRRRWSSSQGIPGLIIDSWGRGLWLYLLSGVRLGSGAVKHGEWSRQHMAAHVGRRTNIRYVSGPSRARKRRKRNADLPCIIRTTTSPARLLARPSTQSYLPSELARLQ